MISAFSVKTIQRWLRWLLSGGLLLLLLYTIDAHAAVAILRRSQPIYLLLAFVVALTDRVLMAYKWTLLLRAKGMKLPLMDSVGVYWVSTFLGLFLPATVGGDALRTYAVAKRGYRTADVISSILIERALGFIALFSFALAGIIANLSVFGEGFIGSRRLFWLFVILLIVSTGAVVLSLNTGLLRRLNTTMAHRQRHAQLRKIVGKLRELHESYVAYQRHRLTLMIFLGLSLVENLLPLIWTYLLALAFQLQVPSLYFFILVPIVLVLVRLPISLDGFGLQEGAFIYFLGLIGVARSEAFLLGIASHILALCSLLPGGLLYALGGLGTQSKPGKETAIGRRFLAGLAADVFLGTSVVSSSLMV